MSHAAQVHTYKNICKVTHSIMTDTGVSGSPASSPCLDATNGLVASLYLTLVVKFIACSFGHLASPCNTPVFYRRSVESILTGS